MAEIGILNTNDWQETNVKNDLKSFVHLYEPKLIHIIKSGWDNPKMYIVVLEDGELGYPETELLNENQIKTKYNITLTN